MQMLKDSISDEQLEKFEAEERARTNRIGFEKLEMALPYGNRHERRKAESIAALEKRLVDLAK